MGTAPKFCWPVDASGKGFDLFESNSKVGDIDITNEDQYTYWTNNAAESLLYDIETKMSTAGANTYSFEVVKDVNNVFGRRDFRLQLRASISASSAIAFEMKSDSGLLDMLGEPASTATSWEDPANSADQIFTFPDSYAGTWMLPAVYVRDNRSYPFQIASSAEAQNGIIAVRIREKKELREVFFNGVPADLVFADREPFTSGIDASDRYAALSVMWEQALRKGVPVRMFVDQDTTDLAKGTYQEFTVSRNQRDDMMSLIEKLDDVMGGAHYNIRINAIVHGINQT